MQKYSASEILALQQEDRPFKVRMLERIPVKSPIKWYTHMSNSPLSSGKAFISETTCFYIVGPQESVIFYSKGPGETKNHLLAH